MVVDGDVAVRYRLTVDGQCYEVGLPELTGLQIRALAAINPTFGLVLESADERGYDRLIEDSDVVRLQDGPTLFCRPPTAMGCF